MQPAKRVFSLDIAHQQVDGASGSRGALHERQRTFFQGPVTS